MISTALEETSALLTQLEQRREPEYAAFMARRTKVSSRPESVLGIRMKWIRQAVKQLSALLTLDEAFELLHEITLTDDASLVEAIRTEITDATLLRMYQQKLRDSRRKAR